MALFTDEERVRAEALAELGHCNPFLPERIEHERSVLGERFVETDQAWHKHPEEEEERPNVQLITQYTEEQAQILRERLVRGEPSEEDDRRLYEYVVLYHLYNKYQRRFFQYVQQAYSPDGSPHAAIDFYDEFQEDMVHFLGLPGMTFSLDEADHLFACFFQIRRAFHHIFDNIIGGSMVAARLRAAVWQSIFTHDPQRYRRALYDKMSDARSAT